TFVHYRPLVGQTFLSGRQTGMSGPHLLHERFDFVQEVTAHHLVGGVQHVLNRDQHVFAAAPVLAHDVDARVSEDLVEDVDGEHEIVGESDGAEERFGDEINRRDEVGDAAAEEDFVAAGDARVVDETPQEHEKVGNEEKKLRPLFQRAAFARDVALNAGARSIVKPLFHVTHGKSAPPRPIVTARPPSMIQTLWMSALTKVGKNRSSAMTNVAGSSNVIISRGSRLFASVKRKRGIGIAPNAEALFTGTRMVVPSARISAISTVNGTLMNFFSDPSTRSSPLKKRSVIRSIGSTRNRA